MDYNLQIEYCKVFNDLVRNENELANTFYDNDGYKKGLPWLYYMTNGLPSNRDSILKPTKQRVKFKATFDVNEPEKNILNKLSFKLATYNLTGHFLGWEDLSDQLFLCKSDPSHVAEIRQIGEIRNFTCSYDLLPLVNKATLPAYANTYFDMFLVDANGDLIDVPVLNKQAEQAGLPILTRRFFLIDTLIGIVSPGKYEQRSDPYYVRYASSIELKI